MGSCRWQPHGRDSDAAAAPHSSHNQPQLILLVLSRIGVALERAVRRRQRSTVALKGRHAAPRAALGLWTSGKVKVSGVSAIVRRIRRHCTLRGIGLHCRRQPPQAAAPSYADDRCCDGLCGFCGGSRYDVRAAAAYCRSKLSMVSSNSSVTMHGAGTVPVSIARHQQKGFSGQQRESVFAHGPPGIRRVTTGQPRVTR
jgi:hypothetical protein